MHPLVDEFGKKLIESVRDDALTSSAVLRNRLSHDPMRKRLNRYDRKCVDDVLDLLIPDLIDTTLFHLLRSLDGGDIKLVYVSDDGRACDLEEEGLRELAGWLEGDDGWITRFSKFPARTA
jgi:hypothetical protein